MYPNNGGLFGQQGIPTDASTMYPQGQQQMNSNMPYGMPRPNGGLQIAAPPPVVDPAQQMIEAQKTAEPLKYSIGDPIVDKYLNRFLS